MAQSAKNRFVEIGRIGKPRGLEGVVRFVPNEHFIDSLFDRHKLYYIKNIRSDLIPARIEEVYVESKRKQQTFFVKLDMIASRSDAESAMNRALFIERKILDDLSDPVQEIDELFGYSVHFDGAEFGEVLDVMQNPAHSILEVKHGVGTLLIPMVDEYVENIDHDKAIVYCKNLDQLTEL